MELRDRALVFRESPSTAEDQVHSITDNVLPHDDIAPLSLSKSRSLGPLSLSLSRWSLASLRELHLRRHLLRNVAVEIKTDDRCYSLFSFDDTKSRKAFIDKVSSVSLSLSSLSDYTVWSLLFSLLSRSPSSILFILPTLR